MLYSQTMTAFEPINVPQAMKLRLRDFMLLHDAGAFVDYAKSELIEGEIWVMNAIYSRHASATAELVYVLRVGVDAAGLDLKLYAPLSVDLSDDSLPEPDIALCEPHASGPMPLAKVKLLIEVSDTTLDIDLGRKAALYARHGVPEYWVIDLNENRALLHMSPVDGEYAEQIDVPFGEVLHSGTIDGLSVATSGLD
jgi:Uma2 family endonuclease